MSKAAPRWTLQAGRVLVRGGVPFASLHGIAPPPTSEGYPERFVPEQWDDLARQIVTLLNAAEAPKGRKA